MGFIKKIIHYWDIGLVILIASLIRLFALGFVPYGFANDEVSYIMSGYEIAKTGGYDISGVFLPLSVNLDSSLSPVPVYIIAIFLKIFDLSPFIARLPFAIMGIGTIVTLYFLSKELFKNRVIALASALSLSLSQWHILVTRSVWDVIPAQLFYLLGLLIFLKKVNKGSVLWSLPFFLLGFYSYHGTKVFFAFLVPLLLIMFWKELFSRRKEMILFVVCIALIFISFAVVMKKESVTRQEEIIFTNKGVQKELKQTIEFERAKSSAPSKLILLESNKITYYLQKMSTNYLGAFSTQHLFTTGDIHPLVGYGVFFKGVLYLLDIPFIILGLIFLIEKSNLLIRKQKKEHEREENIYKRSFLLVVGCLLLAPLPSTIAAGSTYFIRSFMMAPFFSIIIGTGLFAFFHIVNRRSFLRRLGLISVILIYTLFVSRFFYQYYYQLNTFGSEYWNGSSRKLSEYIVNNRSKYDRVIIGGAQDKLILQYAMFGGANPDELRIAWTKKWPAKLGNVTFEDSCYKDAELTNVLKPRTLYVVPSDCHEKILQQNTILDPLEPLRVIWKIYEN